VPPINIACFGLWETMNQVVELCQSVKKCFA